jgi:hypothetical protein
VLTGICGLLPPNQHRSESNGCPFNLHSMRFQLIEQDRDLRGEDHRRCPRLPEVQSDSDRELVSGKAQAACHIRATQTDVRVPPRGSSRFRRYRMGSKRSGRSAASGQDSPLPGSVSTVSAFATDPMPKIHSPQVKIAQRNIDETRSPSPQTKWCLQDPSAWPRECDTGNDRPNATRDTGIAVHFPVE